MDTEVCFRCDCPTGNAGKGDDSLYAPNGAGPYCPACFELVFELANLRAENERLSASESNWHHVADLRAIEIDRLRAEIERLTKINREQCEKGNTYVIENARLTAECADLSHARDSLHTLLRQTLSSRGYFSGTPNDTPSDIVTRVASALGKLEAECEGLRADVVAVARGDVNYFRTVGAVARRRQIIGDWIDCDGTPADILRAVREARNGVS